MASGAAVEESGPAAYDVASANGIGQYDQTNANYDVATMETADTAYAVASPGGPGSADGGGGGGGGGTIGRNRKGSVYLGFDGMDDDA